ncbi:MAG: hypothetical protein IJ417_09190 [Bacteroidaceae bacterium]|nr:hypothetical protein [Bacteroidaceae bacterium]
MKRGEKTRSLQEEYFCCLLPKICRAAEFRPPCSRSSSAARQKLLRKAADFYAQAADFREQATEKKDATPFPRNSKIHFPKNSRKISFFDRKPNKSVKKVSLIQIKD